MKRRTDVHLALLPGRDVPCGEPGCSSTADNFARCRTCGTAIALCSNHGRAVERAERHCA